MEFKQIFDCALSESQAAAANDTLLLSYVHTADALARRFDIAQIKHKAGLLGFVSNTLAWLADCNQDNVSVHSSVPASIAFAVAAVAPTLKASEKIKQRRLDDALFAYVRYEPQADGYKRMDNSFSINLRTETDGIN